MAMHRFGTGNALRQWALWDRGACEALLRKTSCARPPTGKRSGESPRDSSAVLLASFLSEGAPFPRWRLFFLLPGERFGEINSTELPGFLNR